MGLPDEIAQKVLQVSLEFDYEKIKEEFSTLAQNRKRDLLKNFEDPEIKSDRPRRVLSETEKQKTGAVKSFVPIQSHPQKVVPADSIGQSFVPQTKVSPATPAAAPPARQAVAVQPKTVEIAKPNRRMASPQEPFLPSKQIYRRPAVQPGSQKVVMQDIKYVPHLVGPVEELRTIDLDNFRRMGDDPQERIDEIREKLSLLQEDSFAKKLQGIKAWKESQVYKLYLQIGQESLLQSKSISDIIVDKQVKNEPTLSIKEFEAIMQLGKELEV